MTSPGPENLTLRPPATTAEWDAYYDLRWRVLREPWQQPRGSERDDLETTAFHAVAWVDTTTPVGIGRLHRVNETTGQVRFMAVHPDWQRRGIASLVLRALETEAQKLALSVVRLDARDTAVPFYERQGYRVTGELPSKWDIPHRRMEKRLPPPA